MRSEIRRLNSYIIPKLLANNLKRMEKRNIAKENWQRDGQFRVSKIFRKPSFLPSVHDNEMEVS